MLESGAGRLLTDDRRFLIACRSAANKREPIMGSTIVSLRLCAFARAGSGSICVICGPYEWVQLRRQAATPGQVGGLCAFALDKADGRRELVDEEPARFNSKMISA